MNEVPSRPDVVARKIFIQFESQNDVDRGEHTVMEILRRGPSG